MTKINEIWNEMESDNSSTGLLVRRCPASVLPDMFIGLRKQEKLRCIAQHIKKTSGINLSRYANLKVIRPELIPDERDISKAYLLIILNDTKHEDVFATLCEDLINRVAGITGEDKVVKELLNRLEIWKSLFEKISSEGLTPEEQRGLYGEIYFLRKWLAYSNNYTQCIQSWVGPEKAIRDFQYSDLALEVKTTHGNNHQKIQISSERQLDTENLNALFLLHISLEVQQRNGETINELVDAVLNCLNADIASQTQFKSKLLQAGYFTHQRPLYENIGYQIRQENYYHVINEFPRIEEKDIRSGVGDVKYSIIISDYANYEITASAVFERLS